MGGEWGVEGAVFLLANTCRLCSLSRSFTANNWTYTSYCLSAYKRRGR